MLQDPAASYISDCSSSRQASLWRKLLADSHEGLTRVCMVKSHLSCFLAVCSGVGCLVSLGLISTLNHTDLFSGFTPIRLCGHTLLPAPGPLHRLFAHLSEMSFILALPGKSSAASSGSPPRSLQSTLTGLWVLSFRLPSDHCLLPGSSQGLFLPLSLSLIQHDHCWKMLVTRVICAVTLVFSSFK